MFAAACDQAWLSRITVATGNLVGDTPVDSAVDGLLLVWQTASAVRTAEHMDAELTWMSIVEAIAAVRDDLLPIGGAYGRLALGGGPAPTGELVDSAGLRAAVVGLLHAVAAALARHAQTAQLGRDALTVATATARLRRSIPAP